MYSQGKREILEQCIAKAKKQRRGIWAIKGRESAADHKRRMKNGGAPPKTKASSKNVRGGSAVCPKLECKAALPLTKEYAKIVRGGGGAATGMERMTKSKASQENKENHHKSKTKKNPGGITKKKKKSKDHTVLVDAAITALELIPIG